MPERGPCGGVGAQIGGGHQGKSVEEAACADDSFREGVAGRLLVLDQQRGVVADGQTAQVAGGLRVALGHPEAGGVEKFDGGESGGDQLRQRARGGCEVGEEQQRGGRVGVCGDRAEGRLGDEREGALAADDQVREDVGGTGVVQEGVHAVAHGVLQGVETADGLDRGGVAAHSVAQAQQSFVEVGFEGTQPVVGVGRSGVEHRAAGQDQNRGLQSAVGVELGAAGHAAGVVGDDTADGAGRLAGGVRAELAAVAGETGVDRTYGRSGLHAHAGAVVEDLDAAEVATGVDQYAVIGCLAGQAGPTGAERQRHTLRGSGPQQGGDLFGVAGRDDSPGHEQVVRGVVGEGQPVGGTASDRARCRRVQLGE